jgi:hypothetical protein
VQIPGVPQETPGAQIPGVPQDTQGTQCNTIYDLFRQPKVHSQGIAQGLATLDCPQHITHTLQNDRSTYLTSVLDTLDPQQDPHLHLLVTEQMTTQKGVTQFGERGNTAIEKELQ